ncbi:MAG TPA: bifunctional DNA-formamidopyrimidine glycosylase/DNA-(apurinic or apyrimidinic site) lyase [Gemmatimonadota bacterium]|nr:bifunctional DNA-formamidopyrimidine glycosylase/DNA-(apurinic or apyrimidinic site) lyase [Gemmatimonadota bacterium]
MPELPEVETIVRALARHLPGRAVGRARVPRPNVVRGPVRAFVRAVEGSTIESVGRRAKWILFRLDGGRVWTTHLRMTGKYLFEPTRPPARAVLDAADAAYVRAEFGFEDGARLLFVDPRTLGEMRVLTDRAWREIEARLGPEPLEPGFTAEALRARLAGRRRAVKELLLDQAVVAGLGNIYASEALWRARISPRRKGASVGPVRASRLRDAVVDVLTDALGGGGTTFPGATYMNYAGAGGAAGEFYDLLAVYDREGEPCRRCGTAIRRIVQGQRSTYYCPGCQR